MSVGHSCLHNGGGVREAWHGSIVVRRRGLSAGSGLWVWEVATGIGHGEATESLAGTGWWMSRFPVLIDFSNVFSLLHLCRPLGVACAQCALTACHVKTMILRRAKRPRPSARSAACLVCLGAPPSLVVSPSWWLWRRNPRAGSRLERDRRKPQLQGPACSQFFVRGQLGGLGLLVDGFCF